MAERVAVKLGERGYEVVIGENLLAEAVALTDELKPSSTVIVADANLRQEAEVVSAALDARIISIPGGEQCKSLAQLEHLYADLTAPRELDRDALIVALGGGSIGDLAGFAAATLFRGVRWVAMPTSLLAMVDAAIGGKTAVNFGADKNVIGAFHQPAAVLCDLRYLQTLPQREYASALAEVVKCAAIKGEDFMNALERWSGSLQRREPPTVAACVRACVEAKAGVVEVDERDANGRRMALNFGHTLGHALEATFPGRWLHGEAVAIGIAGALRVSMERAGLPATHAERIRGLLLRFSLPTEVPPELELEALRNAILSDKKRASAHFRLVLLKAIGSVHIESARLDDALLGLLTGRGNA